MNWETAKSLLVRNIRIRMHLTPEYGYKIVTEIPPYKCRNYANDTGFRIQVGKKSFINIPLSMLELLFASSLQNQYIYDHSVFKSLYPKQIEVKPCHVHSVGKLFEFAGVMEKIGPREYRIKHSMPS